MPKASGTNGNCYRIGVGGRLTKVLLKARGEKHGVAQKLVATASDLIEIAAGVNTVPALAGWRYDIFGCDALKLKNGTLALSVKDGTVSITESHISKPKTV